MRVYLPEKERKRAKLRLRLKIAVFTLIAGLMAAGTGYVVFYSSLFRLHEVVVTGNRFTDEARILSTVQSSIIGNSFVKRLLGHTNYLVWPEEAPSIFFTFLPAISEAKITRDYFEKKITITVKERERFGVWCRANECFWFDRDGVIFDNAPSAQSSLLPTIHDYSKTDIPLGSRVFSDSKHIENILAAFEIVNAIGIGIEELNLSRPELREFYVKTYDGAELRFSLDLDPRPFASALYKLKVDPGLKKLEYIDMRVENRIYYKPR